jgi:hypothetical protein
MAKIINMFSNSEVPKVDFTREMVNEVVPALRKVTEDAIRDTNAVLAKVSYVPEKSMQYKLLEKEFDEAVMRWVDKIHRLGGYAKDMWLVDFDTGEGYLCWRYPEPSIEYFHSYTGGFKTRKRLTKKN